MRQLIKAAVAVLITLFAVTAHAQYVNPNQIKPGTFQSGSFTFPGAISSSYISGLHMVDGVNTWSAANTITAAYDDACVNGGTVEISQYYAGTEVIPASCPVSPSPVQTYVRVVDDRTGPFANTGVLNAMQFGMDATGATSDTATLGTLIAATHYGPTYNSALLNAAPIFFPAGQYQVNEVSVPSTFGSIAMYGVPGTTGSRIYYGGNGGTASYTMALPDMAFGTIRDLYFNGVNSNYHTGVGFTNLAQTGLLFNVASAPEIDALFRMTGVGFLYYPGNAFQLGTSTQPGEVTNGFFDHFRCDGIGGYCMAFYLNNTANGDPLDFGNFTQANSTTALYNAYCIQNNQCTGTGSTFANGYNQGALFISKARGTNIKLHDARLEEDQATANFGNASQGYIWSNDDSSSNGGAAINFLNMAFAEATVAVHPIVSTATGNVSVNYIGANTVTAASSLYKNRLTQAEYGDQFKANGAFWSFGHLPSQFQGGCLENWCMDVIPVASRSTNAVPRSLGDWFIRRGTDMSPGTAGPLDVVVSPTTGGRASLEASQAIENTGTLATNSTFVPSYVASISAGSGGTISGVGTCTLSSFNNGLTGAMATVTFTTSGSWSGATFIILTQGTGITSVSGLTATLSNGSAVTTGAPANCAGTATLTATLSAPSASTYANLTGFIPTYPAQGHIGIHIGDNITITNSGSGGTGSTQVTVSCIDAVGSGNVCAGLGSQGIVVSPAPACLPSSCAASGSVTANWTQATLSNFGLEANRVSTIPTSGTSCPYQSDFDWLSTPAVGSIMNSSCSSSLLWVNGPAYGATAVEIAGTNYPLVNFNNTLPAAPTNGINVQWQYSANNASAAIVGDGTATHFLNGTGSFSAAVLVASLTTTSATTDNVTVTGMTSSGHCQLTPTDASGATNIATTYISAKTTNQITVTHTATASMTYDVMCTSN